MCKSVVRSAFSAIVLLSIYLIGPSPVKAQAQFRAFWADAFHSGYKSTAQIDDMVSRAVGANYNAIIAEVLAYHDNVGGGHGAYWNSAIVPKASDISGGIDPLAYLLQQAHANGIEVHGWIVAFRACTTWPPSGNATVAAHPEWLMVPQGAMGGGPAPVDSAYQFDPGSPDFQEYLMSIVRELITNYEIDGIHWDYIRYTQTDAGYPADTSYTRSSLARFQQITGRSDTPSTGDAQWNDFRRRTINEVIARCRAEVPSIANPRQPLRHSAALIPWGDAPSVFTNSSAYGLFQNWELWMREGWLDAGCPMFYFREHNSSQAQWYRNWVNAALGWRYDRHMYTGQAVYLNSMANSVTQMQYAYGQGVNGTVNYSYYATADNDLNGSWENDWSWYTSYCPTNMFTSPAVLPTMPWRDPATATEGTLWGQVRDSDSGLPVDDVTVQVGALDAVQTDGNGYYVKTLIPATAGGTTYDLTADKTGYPTVLHAGVTVVAGDIRREDLTLGEDPPCSDDSACDDGMYCNGIETCVAGSCQPGTPVSCDDGIACTADACNEATDACDRAPNDSACDNGVFCDGVEVCDVLFGCQTGGDPCAGLMCDEGGDFCYDESCDYDGVCEAGEDCASCPTDCISGGGGGCGNGVCEPALGEDCLSCPSDCNGKQVGAAKRQFCCGDGDGQNPVGCDDPQCTNADQGFACSDVPAEPYCCGDFVCEGLEDSYNCAIDCGAPAFCGDGSCDVDEDACSCPADCGAPPATESNCADGLDEDCDGLPDCEDGDCAADPACSCAPKGNVCSQDSDCCSGKCRGDRCR